jgi:hypothetical protein
MPESVVEERPDSEFNNPSRGSEVCGSGVDNFNSRGNGKVIGNGNALTATAKRAKYGVRITHFYNLLLRPRLRNHFLIGNYILTSPPG